MFVVDDFMPIKFRCPHCQQFLGISRNRAGAVTDCPSCGRSIRVPNLEGTVDPLPPPEMNLADAGLASALEKLANISGASADSADQVRPVLATEPAAPGSPRMAVAEPLVVAPAPAPPPRIVEVAIRTAPSAAEGLLDEAGRPSRDAALESLATLAAGDTRSTGRFSNLRSWLKPVVWGLGVFVLFAGGYVTGRSASVEPTVPEQAPVAADQHPAAAPVARATEPAISGRVSYIATDGQSLPDAGARVLVLPEERQGTSLLPPEGFRPGAIAEDLQLAQAAARALGGDFAITDSQGQFEIQLPRAGAYQVLILSRYQQRESASDAINWLTAYFERPAQIVGQAAENLSAYRYRGSGTAPRDHTFPLGP